MLYKGPQSYGEIKTPLYLLTLCGIEYCDDKSPRARGALSFFRYSGPGYYISSAYQFKQGMNAMVKMLNTMTFNQWYDYCKDPTPESVNAIATLLKAIDQASHIYQDTYLQTQLSYDFKTKLQDIASKVDICIASINARSGDVYTGIKSGDALQTLYGTFLDKPTKVLAREYGFKLVDAWDQPLDEGILPSIEGLPSWTFSC